ncbi:MAG: hypothetical protein WBW71_16395 [Bacteroidota bacterium]
MRAKQPATIEQDLARADWIPSLRHFVAQLSSGPLGSRLFSRKYCTLERADYEHDQF